MEAGRGAGASRTGRGVLVLVCGVVALGVLTVLGTRMLQQEDQQPLDKPAPIKLKITKFEALPGWESDDLAGLVEAFLRSCPVHADRASNAGYMARPFGGGSWALPGGEPVAGRRADWHHVCAGMAALPQDTGQIRRFLEAEFTPVSVEAAPESAQGTSSPQQTHGLFTGYYEPEMTGSREPKTSASVPLLEKPDDLIAVNLGDFRDELKGKRLAGRIVGTALKPYEDRGAIEAGDLWGKARPLVWIDDPVDAFFLHIQGSGRVLLDGGQTMRVGYAGQNGHPYVAIGKVLIERGEMTREAVSMQAIRTWLTSHEAEAKEVMNINTSYVFFHELDITDPNLGPHGAGGTSLTPWRSLAVDRSFHALGVPVWLDTVLPPGSADGEAEGTPLQRLMVAQDTGGAITGPVRGDVFFGWGEEAADLAGHMKSQGTMTLLLPNALAARLQTSLQDQTS
jgi:membrane-bound lytic murein transglycosylase A